MDNFIAKIEGHGSLDFDWSKQEVKLNIHEGERLFEGMLVGRTAEDMHWITPRICGVCPTAHSLASLAALEDALGMKISKTTKLLRELMQCGQIIQSHILHLFFLSLPDYLGIDRGTELAKKDPGLFKKALALKELSDLIVGIVGGRHTHPTTPTIGGFHKLPSKKKLKEILKKLENTESDTLETVELVEALNFPKLQVDFKLIAQIEDSVVLVDSKEFDNKQEFLVKNYKKNIQEEVRDYSTAKFGKYQNQELFAGALARLAIYPNYNNNYEVNYLKKHHLNLDFANPFHNNIAQAVECLYYHQKAQEIINDLINMNLEKEIAEPSGDCSGEGVGVTEAPRGGLYHEVTLDGNLKILEANIITPTVQNLTSIEKSAKEIIVQNPKTSNDELEKLIVMLVRAYDPCITCSVH